MLRRHAIGFRSLLMLVDAALAVGLLAAVSYARFGEAWLAQWDIAFAAPWAFPPTYAAGWVVILWLHGLYRPRARWTMRSEALAIGRAVVVMALVTFSVLFLFRLPDVSRSFLLLYFPAQWLATVATRLLLRWGFQTLRTRGYNQRFVLMVGAGPRGQAFAKQLSDHQELGLGISGFVDDLVTDLPRGWKHLGPFNEIELVLRNHVIDEVAICLPFSQLDRINAIAALCEEEGKIVRVPIDLLDRTISSGHVEDLDGTLVYSLVNGPDRVAALVVKRVVDIVGSLTALVLASPLLLAIAAVLRFGQGAPVLFRQVRIGLHGRQFTVVKFRTMTIDAEARLDELLEASEVSGAAFKMSNDPRITRVGKWLRRTSLDELPQLWNVLRGDMSLVGPRPALPREVADYDLWHRRRLSMKPGITGLWQVTARRSGDFDNRAELDLTYIDRWSLWLDLKILARTLPAALEGR